MAIRAAYASYKEIRLEIIMLGTHIQTAGLEQPTSRVRKTIGCTSRV
jgi:hypothetical protein